MIIEDTFDGIIKPLRLGQLTFPHNLIQAPLAGISCSAFRQLAYQFTPPAYACSEMIMANDLIKNKNTPLRYLHRAPMEETLCYQVAGKTASTLATAATHLSALGADIIDLNCGCPKPKIRRKGLGSKLLETPDLLFQLVQAVRKNCSLTLSVKIRIDGQQDSGLNSEVVQAIVAGGADFIIVHGRNWQDDYDVNCFYEQIAEIVEESALPVIGNGDICDLTSLKRMASQTHCAGFMIARASMGQPWLYQQLIEEAQGHTFRRPTPETIITCYLNHLQNLQTLESEKVAVMQMRRLAKFYFARENSEEADTLLQKLYRCETVQEILLLVK
jgi:tRNA-dihydrouridine synthase B